MCQRPTISKCVENWEKLNHLGSYEQELKVLNRVDLVLGYSWNLNNSPQRMDYQKSDRRGRRKGWKRGGGWGNEGSKRCMNALFVCLFFLAGWFFLCTPGLKSFLLLFFLNPYFDLFYSVIRLNFPHPLPHPRGWSYLYKDGVISLVHSHCGSTCATLQNNNLLNRLTNNFQNTM